MSNNKPIKKMDSPPKRENHVMNITQPCSESETSKDLPDFHKGRMIVEMRPNTMQVPYFCFTFSYKYPELKEVNLQDNAPQNKKPKVTQESSQDGNEKPSDPEKVVVYKERGSMFEHPPVLSNKVLAGILRNIRNAYINFKIHLVHANSWLFEYDHSQDLFFEEKLVEASDKIKKCIYGNVSLWSSYNINKLCLDSDDEDLSNLIIAIHVTRVVGFTAEIDHKKRKVKVLVFHQARTEVHEYAHDCDFVAYGYPKDDDEHNESDGDY